MSIGEKIRDLRQNVGLSQSQLAAQVSIARPTLCQIERGSKAPSLPLSKALADALGCSVMDFLSDSEPPTS